MSGEHHRHLHFCLFNNSHNSAPNAAGAAGAPLSTPHICIRIVDTANMHMCAMVFINDAMTMSMIGWL